MGRLYAQEHCWDNRFWQVINYAYNSQIKEEDKRVKPGAVFPSLGPSRVAGVMDAVTPKASFDAVMKQLGAIPGRQV